MATFPTSIARLVEPNRQQFTQKDNVRLKAVRRRMQSRMNTGNKSAMTRPTMGP